ncbi:nucleotidyltransferase family protein [Geoglobus acetivorans]|uniref:Nucleotidyltransferase n=1 Tax=Geoglobus acetivorans TaxID=565033 RepID=A0A0A7GG59_GEOAI|nr:Nucleotidyltransferase [Geoglobus acetivorans]
MEKELKVIKEVILEIAEEHGIEVEKVVLFGSRARGDFKEDSDWDILIVTNERLDKNAKSKFILEVRREIVWKLEVPVDVIVVDSNKYGEYEQVYGSVIGQAASEGITV